VTVTLGLTGSIGMGKSTTAQMFRDRDVPVWDADAAVHALYAPGGAAVPDIAALVPEAVVEGGVDRARLRAALDTDPGLLARIEAVVHPRVAAHRADFLRAHADADLVLLDIPLLFETGGAAAVDAVVVVSTDAETQRARVLQRPDMTQARLDQILARQMPDAEKRRRADYVIETDTLDGAREQVDALIRRLMPQKAQGPASDPNDERPSG
jgi:dephospho-CoA kinase